MQHPQRLPTSANKLLVGCAAHLRWHGAASYRYEGARTCAPPLAALRARLRDIGTILTRRLALRGCFGFDFLWQGEDRVALVDINPRPPATLDFVGRCPVHGCGRYPLAAVGV